MLQTLILLTLQLIKWFVLVSVTLLGWRQSYNCYRIILSAICQSKRTRVRKWKRKIAKTGQKHHGWNNGNTEAKYIYKSLAKKTNGKSLLSKMSIIRRGFFPFTVEGERPRRGEVIWEEYLIIFFLSRKSPNSISCHIFSTQLKTIPENN